MRSPQGSWLASPEADQQAVLLFLHGTPGWSWAHRNLFTPALTQQYQLLVPDRPGFGGSHRTGAMPSLQAQGQWLMALLDKEIAGRPLVVAGHSYGGPLALRMALDFPNVVTSAVLISAGLDPQLEPQGWKHTWFAFQQRLPGFLGVSGTEMWHLPAELAQLALDAGKLTVPTVLLHGLRDRICPPGNIDFARVHLPSGLLRIKTEPRAGHQLPWTHARFVEKVLLEA